jgi:serine/threonine protein kinase/WD40 repeat protein
MDLTLDAVQPPPNPYDETMMRPDVKIEVGSSVGCYKLLQELGSGGMGVVYMAEQQHPVRRKVALKIIKPGMDTREVLARFEQERQALAMMDHPNIARVLDAGSTPTGCPYFVMEHVKGVPMTEYCDKENLDTRQRLELFIDVCRAVQHAHQKGIIHRDLKPLNILVSVGDGRPVPKVIDFGIAKATGANLTDKTLFTRINQPVGTPAYMSPEQAEMTGLDIDTRSDIYSLGVLLYELLTGSTPLEPKKLASAGVMEMQRMIREEEPQRPSTRLSTLSDATLAKKSTRMRATIEDDLDRIVMKSLEKDRNRRYETAGAFAQDVDNFLKGEMVLARSPSTAYRLSKFFRRNKRWVVPVAAMIGLLIVATAVSVWQAIRASNAAIATKKEKDRADAALKQSIKATAQSQRNLQTSLGATATALTTSGMPGQRFGAIKAILDAASIEPSLELRNLMINALRLPDVRTTWSYETSYPPHIVAFNSNLKICAIGDTDGNIDVLDVRTSTLLMKVPSAGKKSLIRVLQFGNGGRFLAIGFDDGRLTVWDLQLRQVVLETKFVDEAIYLHPIKPIIASASQVRCEFRDLFSNTVLSTFRVSRRPYALALDSSGEVLAMSYLRRGIDLLDPKTGDVLFNIASDSPVRGIALNDDSTLLAAACDDFRIRTWALPALSASLNDDANTSIGAPHRRWSPNKPTKVAELIGHGSQPVRVVFPFGTNTLFSQGWDDSVRLWDPVNGFQLFWLSARDIHVSSDGKSVAFRANNRLSVGEFETGRECQVISHSLADSICDRPEIEDLGDRVRSAVNVVFSDFYNAKTPLKGPASIDMNEQASILATADEQTIALWNVHSGRLIAAANYDGGPCATVLMDQVSRDGQMITMGKSGLHVRAVPRDLSLDRDIQMGVPKRVFANLKAEPLAMCLGPNLGNGRDLAVCVRQQIHLYHRKEKQGWENARLVRTFETDGYSGSSYRPSIAISPDGKLLATAGASGSQVRVWTMDGKEPNVDISLEKKAEIAFTADSQYLIIGRADQFDIVNILQNDIVTTILRVGATDRPANCAMSPNGQLAALAIGSKLVKMFTVYNWEEVAAFEVSGASTISCLRFGEGGRRLAISTQDLTTRIWDLDALRHQLGPLSW